MTDNSTSASLIFAGKTLTDELRLLIKTIHSSMTGIIITDNRQPDNPIIFCNEAFEYLTGYKRTDIIGHNCRFLQGDDRSQEARKTLRDAVKQGKSVRVNIRNYRKDGSLFYNELYMSPVRNEAGEIDYFIGVQNDVSKRMKVEEELRHEREGLARKIEEATRDLRQNEEYLASIIETVRESLLVLSPEMQVLGVNEHFLRVFKVSLEETKGRELFELGNGQWNIPKLRLLLDQILPTSNPVLDFEVQHDFPHIGTKLMLLNAYRVELEGKYKDRILLAIEDITERRAVETRKDDFLSIASHELKTPLTSIKGYHQLALKLLKPGSDDRVIKVLERSERSIERLGILIEELLDVARLHSGQLQLQLEQKAFDPLVRQTVQEFQETVPDRSIEISGQTSASPFLDEVHLVQVIVNLLSNAVKYSPDGGTIQVHMGQVGDFVRLSITDHGVGITMEEQKHIFDRFFRSQSIQNKYPGMGIGLYICDKIIKNHHGSLWVESTHGQGSTFNFTLPLQKRHEKT